MPAHIYCNPQQIAKYTNQDETNLSSTSSDRHTRVLRSAEEGFSFKTDCFFCGSPAKFGRKRKSQDVLQVKTVVELKDTVLATCNERGDSWSDTVKARLMHVS